MLLGSDGAEVVVVPSWAEMPVGSDGAEVVADWAGLPLNIKL
ncbi:hypothetical protein [Anaplasma marginale]|nr:hypothetical protein [Anaplasma marginale]